MSRPRSDGHPLPGSPDRRDVLFGIATASVVVALPAVASGSPAHDPTATWEQSWGLYNESHLFFVDWAL